MTLCLIALFSLAAFAQPPNGVDPNKATVWVNAPKAGSLPRRVSHRTYYSESMKRDVGYLIYLPAAHELEPGRRFPVIYNLHGAGGNELHGLQEAELLEEGIAAKKWPPMILVMPNGGKYTYYKDSADGRYMGETTIMRELIPHIDKTYRTVAGREGRAIEGFSMGGRGATRLALKYPEMFCSLFNQAGNVFHTSEKFDPSKPEVYPNNYLGKDKARFIADDPYLILEKNIERVKRLRIQVACGTKDDGHLPSVREFHQALVKWGVDHTYFEVEGLAHERTKLVSLYRAWWFDYHVESFRRAAAK